jgi:molecular chaperone DnaK (HSP70)
VSKGGDAVIEWNKIRAEYIADGTTYRQLAAKYGVSLGALGKRAEQEGWVELREQKRNKTTKKVVESLSDKEARQTVSIDRAADKLIERIFKMIEDEENPLTPQSIKSLTSALEDLKRTKGIKSQKDQEEQDARIAKLRREAGIGDEVESGGVIVLPDANAPLIDEEDGCE